MTTSISVIITTYNWPNALAAVLTGLLQQTDQQFSVLIADDGSTEEIKTVIHSFQPQFGHQLKHIWQEDDEYRAAMIRNKAAAQAESDYLIFIDADCVPNQNFIARHRQLAEKNYFTSGSRILLNQEFTQKVLQEKIVLATWTVADWWRARQKGYCQRMRPAIYLPLGMLRKIKKRNWKACRACNLGVFRQDFISINGFDESYYGWGMEDSDLAIRLIKKGIYYKSSRFAAFVAHLWHRQSDRSYVTSNRARLQKLFENDITWAEKGVKQYL
jgi:glycosyltransferase involved in cell wall biosynthesis